MRAFVAIALDEQVRERVACVQRELMRGAGKVAWVAPERAHLTLRFIGEVEPAQLPELESSLQEAIVHPPFELSLQGVGAFPTWSRPRVVWLGVDEGRAEVEAIARQVSQAVTNAGFAPADHPFRPHVTLGRVKDHTRWPRSMLGLQAGKAQVREVILYRSELSSHGAKHTPLKRFALQGLPFSGE